jgi:hypothetical protein
VDLIQELPGVALSNSDDADFILEFRKVAFFDSLVIDKLIKLACASGSAVITNSYGVDSPSIDVAVNDSVDLLEAFDAPILLKPKSTAESGYKNVKMHTNARSFVSNPSLHANYLKPVVTTILRYHKSANLNELRNALFCIYAMEDCVVIPLVAAQDLNRQQIETLENMLNDFNWDEGCEPQVQYYQSKDGDGDLRSKMLNESLKHVKTRYAAFLDFDDLVMPFSYCWMINRLQNTDKAVVFGRVYSTSCDSTRGLLIKRTRAYEYGYSYDEFVNNNHAPLHSFMLDLERLDLSNVVYFEDQRYMEDYLLTLQLFTKDNADWESLKENFYIGDYTHSVNRAHTLAILNEWERQELLSNSEYLLCAQRINDMQKSIKKKY